MSKQMVSSMFSVIEWKNEELGFIECPGKHFHTGKNSKRDCAIYLDGPPTITCFHSSCYGVVEEANYKMRRAIWDNDLFPRREFSDEEKAKIKVDMEQKKKERALRDWSENNKEIIFKNNEWPLADVFHESPLTNDDPKDDGTLFIFRMFKEDDIIWNGDVKDTGQPEHKSNFRTVKDFLRVGVAGNFTCGSTFKKGTISRKNENVLSRPYLVVESDTLTIDETCSLFKWMKTFMTLRAIVHSGGKSAHGWFEFPEERIFQKLKIVLPELGCDPALFKPSQPVRMPGVKRGDNMQYLAWLK